MFLSAHNRPQPPHISTVSFNTSTLTIHLTSWPISISRIASSQQIKPSRKQVEKPNIQEENWCKSVLWGITL